MGSKPQLFMDTQSIPQSLSLWGWSGSPIPGIGRARHTCLGHPLSSHFLLTITDRKPGHKDSWTVTCIVWPMCGRFEPRSVRPKFGCADTSLVGHSWNSMWMVACIHPSPSFPHEVLYVQEVWLWSWPFLRLPCCHHLWLLTSWISVPLFKFLLFKKFLLHLLWLHFLSDFCHPLYYYCVVILSPPSICSSHALAFVQKVGCVQVLLSNQSCFLKAGD